MATKITSIPSDALLKSAQYFQELESLEKLIKDNSSDFYVFAAELVRLQLSVNKLAGQILKGEEGIQFRNNIADFQKKQVELHEPSVENILPTDDESKNSFFFKL